MQSFQLIELLDDTVESRGLDTVKNFAELLVNWYCDGTVDDTAIKLAETTGSLRNYYIHAI